MHNDQNNEEYEYCPRCDANLTLQKGYSNTLPYWVCKGCGEMLINPDVDADDDVAWFCDGCNAMLNVQEGFRDNNGTWKCACCGYENAIDEKNLYDTEEAFEADLNNPYKGLTDEQVLKVSAYREEKAIEGSPNVMVVSDPETGRLYIKKYLKVYDKSIYEFLIDNPVAGMPKIHYIAEGSNGLVVIEEYIEGRTVGELIGEGSLTAELALDIARKICGVLVVLHRLPEPIIHRDIKPSNVIVSPSGDVILLDMNAARWDRPDRESDTGYYGTMNYAAPEQLWYGLKASSAKSDIYALGVLLNVMLTGAIPKEKHAEEPMWSVIERCIRLEADERLSAEELLNVLEKISGGGESDV